MQRVRSFAPIFFSELLLDMKQRKEKVCQEWDSNPRTDTCTRIPMHYLLAISQTKVALESGALDRSAILTT